MKTDDFLYSRNEELHNELTRIRGINAELLAALTRLRCEAVHYKNTHRGQQFLVDAIIQANQAIAKAESHATNP